MNHQTKYDLKRARRKFAAKYLFVPAEVVGIEGVAFPLTLVAVTDTGTDPCVSLFNFADPGKAVILVSCKQCEKPTDLSAVPVLPHRFDGYPVFYYWDHDYLTRLGTEE